MMLWKRIAQSRIPLFRPLRPPNYLFVPRPSIRPFTHNTQLLLMAYRAKRPHLPYLLQPAPRFQPTLLGPNPQLARLLSTEMRTYMRELSLSSVKWAVITGSFLILGSVIWFGYEVEVEERRDPTPEEFTFYSRAYLRQARISYRQGQETGIPDHGAIAHSYRECLKRLEDPAIDGKGVQEVQDADAVVPEGGRAALDISAKSWPWRACYYEAAIRCANAAEHLEGKLLDRTSRIIYTKEKVVGPSNPDPRPMPSWFGPSPLEENCDPAFEAPDVYYMRILAGKGFTTSQRLDALAAYGTWLKYKGLNEKAEEMFRSAIDIAKAGLPLAIDATRVIENQTAVLRAGESNVVTSNLLHAATSMGVHHARTGNVSAALPVLLSVLRARRSAPILPFTPGVSATERVTQAEFKEPTTDIGNFFNFFRKIMQPPVFPPPPPSGDEPFVRADEKPTCEDSELMLYIGEIMFASSPQPTEGLGWTRQGVAIAEANLQEIKAGRGNNRADRPKCTQCLKMGLGNWETMLQQTLSQQDSFATREGSRDAGLMEWRGWFGRGSGIKGKTLDELNKGVIEAELEQVEKLKEELAQDETAKIIAIAATMNLNGKRRRP